MVMLARWGWQEADAAGPSSPSRPWLLPPSAALVHSRPRPQGLLTPAPQGACRRLGLPSRPHSSPRSNQTLLACPLCHPQLPLPSAGKSLGGAAQTRLQFLPSRPLLLHFGIGTCTRTWVPRIHMIKSQHSDREPRTAQERERHPEGAHSAPPGVLLTLSPSLEATPLWDDRLSQPVACVCMPTR